MRRLRLPFLLYSYIAAELLAPFFASFLILYAVFFLVRLIPFLEVVLDLRIGFADFVRLFAYIFPHMLLYVIPMASMTGVIIGFTRLTNDREILALKACGISLRQMVPPVLMVATVIALLTGYFSVHLIPAGEVAMKQLMFQLAKEKIDKGLKERSFTEALGDLVVYVDRIDEQDRWHGVYVSDMRNRQQPMVTMARSGYMIAETEKMQVTIVLNNGTLHNTDGQDTQVIRFNRYQLEIPLKPPTRIDGEDVTQLSKGSMTQAQLLEAAEKLGPASKHGVIYLSEYHHRLVLPVGCFILSLLGMPLGLQAGPGRRAIGIPLGLAFFVLYYITLTTGRVMTENLVVPPLFGMWLPNVVFFVLMTIIFWRVDHEQPLLPERVQNLLAFCHDRLDPILSRGKMFTRKLLSRRNLRTVAVILSHSGKMEVLANAHTREYHLPGCMHCDKNQCTIKFRNARVAQKAGFKECLLCRAEKESRQH